MSNSTKLTAVAMAPRLALSVVIAAMAACTPADSQNTWAVFQLAAEADVPPITEVKFYVSETDATKVFQGDPRPQPVAIGLRVANDIEQINVTATAFSASGACVGSGA